MVISIQVSDPKEESGNFAFASLCISYCERGFTCLGKRNLRRVAGKKAE